MSLSVYSLFSGSSANSTLVRSESTCILIDAGGSMKRVRLALESLGLSPADLSAIFVTHEHRDHIAAIPMLTKHFHLPVHITAPSSYALSGIGDCMVVHPPIYEVALGDMMIRSFPTSHDSAMSVGYTICSDGQKFGIATDTGIVTSDIADALLGSDAALIEANHDIDMLKSGPYPAELKARIRSDRGHLSNAQSAKLAEFLVKGGTRSLLLGHLSAENNAPSVAHAAVSGHLAELGLNAHIAVAARTEVTELVLPKAAERNAIC